MREPRQTQEVSAEPRREQDGAAMPPRSDGKIDRSPDMLLVGYALARMGDGQAGRADGPPHWLNVKTWNAAYDLFFDQLADGRTAKTFRFSLKNARDKFDPHLPSRRRGWLTPSGERPEPTGWVQQIIGEWRNRTDAELQEAVLKILRRPSLAVSPQLADDWEKVRRRLDRMTRQTVLQSGKVQRRILKNKELRCVDLDATLDNLLRLQGYRCAQTGVDFVEHDPDLRASLDRIDSDGHYEDGSLGDGPHNLQLVTHWYNLAKGTRTDTEMQHLLAVHARHFVRSGSAE
jgi:hypothetical protein